MKTAIPTLSDLHLNSDHAFKQDQLNLLLSQPPHASWIKKHPVYQNEYLPIDKIEFLLLRIFQHYRVEVMSFSQLTNSVAVHIRLHYVHPIEGSWSFHDGVGAAPIQVDKGANASDLGAIKTSAIQQALPIAKSMAIKDAAEQFGALFGKDLNRKNTVQFEGFFTSQKNEIKTEKL
jgi:hypothetical protein